jgi:hypothetical protein
LIRLDCSGNYMPDRSAVVGYSSRRYFAFDPQNDPQAPPKAEEAKPQQTQAAASAPTAKPTSSEVLVNVERIVFDAYNIDGNNYFKLRDLAYALNGTEKQFEVGYDNATKVITLTRGTAYTPVGGEMAGKGTGDKTPTPTTSRIYLDGAEITFTVYSIDGSNYFKLRDLGEALNFSVTYDAATRDVRIDTPFDYTE